MADSKEETLLDKFYGIVDGYYQHSADFKDVAAALRLADQGHKDIAQRAWNAALDLYASADSTFESPYQYQSPGYTYFDEWYEREVANPPDTVWSAEEYGP